MKLIDLAKMIFEDRKDKRQHEERMKNKELDTTRKIHFKSENTVRFVKAADEMGKTSRSYFENFKDKMENK